MEMACPKSRAKLDIAWRFCIVKSKIDRFRGLHRSLIKRL